MPAHDAFSRSPDVLECPKPFHDATTGFDGWRVHLNHGRAVTTPAISGNRLFVGGGFGSYDFYAVNLRSGDLDWHLKTQDDGPTSAVLDDDLAVFNTESCTLEVVEMPTGRVLWETWLGDPLLAQPAVSNGRVFMAYPSDSGHHRMAAFSLREGNKLWETRLDHDVITAPVVAEGKLYAATFEGTVRCLDPVTGKVAWSRPMQATSAPWIYHGHVYVSRREDRDMQGDEHSHDDDLSSPGTPREGVSRHHSESGVRTGSYAAKLAHYLHQMAGSGRKQAYSAQDGSVGFGVAPSSAKLDRVARLIGESHVSRTWRFQGSRPVVVAGVLYDTTGDKLEASDCHTGEVLWSWDDASPLEGERRLTPPAVANGRVWAGTWDGRIISWDAGTGEVRWAVKVGAPCHWQPVIHEGWVAAGLENGRLVGFYTGDPLDTGWPMWGGGSGHNGMPEPIAVANGASVDASPILGVR